MASSPPFNALVVRWIGPSGQMPASVTAVIGPRGAQGPSWQLGPFADDAAAEAAAALLATGLLEGHTYLNTTTHRFRVYQQDAWGDYDPQLQSAVDATAADASAAAASAQDAQTAAGTATDAAARVDDVFNLWFDPDATGELMAAIAGSRILTDGLPTRHFQGAGQVFERIDVPATDAFRPGASLVFTYDARADIAGSQSLDTGINFYNAAGTKLTSPIATALTTANVWQAKAITAVVPADAAKLRFYIGKGTTSGSADIRNVELRSSLQKNEIYPNAPPAVVNIQGFRRFISSTADPASLGTSADAPTTIPSALTMLAKTGGEIIIVDSADYTDAINFALTPIAGPLIVRGAPGHRPRFNGGTLLGGITKTVGYTKVYQTSKNPLSNKYLWLDRVEDAQTLIAAADRHALQRGRTHRLQHTRISLVGSIAAVEASAVPAFFYSGGVTYFSLPGGADATDPSFKVYLPTTTLLAFHAGSADITLVNLESVYGGGYGIRATNTGRVVVEEIMAGYNTADAISFDECPSFSARYSEFAGAGNDGVNSHSTLDASAGNSTVGSVENLWSHDNYDDGQSEHENTRSHVLGGLYEENGSSGITWCFGNHGTAIGTIARRNNHRGNLTSAGFVSYQTVLSPDLGIGTQVSLINCTSQGHAYNFMAGFPDQNTPDNSLDAIRCTSLDASIGHFYAGSCDLRATDCTYDGGAGAAKVEEDGGQVIIRTGTALS